MTLTILDPNSGTRVTIEVPVKRQPRRRIRRQLLHRLEEISTARQSSCD